MAEYGYKNRWYVTQEKSRSSGNTIQRWGSSNNGVDTRPDQWRNTGDATNCDGRQDHRCSPVSIFAEGPKNVVFAYPPGERTQYTVTKSETIIEHVPLVRTKRFLPALLMV